MPKKRRGRAERPLPVRIVQRGEAWQALEVGGVVQSVALPAGSVVEDGPGPGGGYWGLMLPSACPERALLLGLGGGTVAALVAARCPGVQIDGVERDASVLAAARESLGLGAIPGLVVHEADAFHWVAERAADRDADHYPYICMDLFHGGRLALGALGTPFLRQVASLLAADGTLAVNLMVTGRTPEQLHRLRRVFHIQREQRLRGNLVVHLSALAEGETPE